VSDAISGAIAAARAYAGAGNFRLAERHLKTILATDPDNGDACEVWCQLLTKQKKFAELEPFAKSWIGRDGQNETAYTYLFGSYVARKDRNNAMAVLKRYGELFPEQVLQHIAFQSMVDLNCADEASGYDEAIAAFQSVGDQAQVLRFQSQAAFRRSDFAEAIRLGDQSWQAGYRETSFASYMALICFRSLRFGKSRQYSRFALRAEPGHPVATELLVLTRLVWFPPFLLAHALLFLLTGVSSNRVFGAIAGSPFVVLAGIFLALFGLLSIPLSATTIFSLFILMICWCFYAPFIGKIAAFAYRNGAPTIRLSGY
jgi:tetratricopeptide (TPR) repeat protein